MHLTPMFGFAFVASFSPELPVSVAIRESNWRFNVRLVRAAGIGSAVAAIAPLALGARCAVLAVPGSVALV